MEQFTIVLRGYDINAVERLIGVASEALASGSPTERETAVRELREPDLRIRFRGYDRFQVDAALRLLVDELSDDTAGEAG
jgi:hypothetical protein